MEDLLIRQKVEGMILYGYIALRQFPKAERHVLSQEIRQTMWEYVRRRIVSWLGHAQHADSYRLRRKLLGTATFVRTEDL